MKRYIKSSKETDKIQDVIEDAIDYVAGKLGIWHDTATKGGRVFHYYYDGEDNYELGSADYEEELQELIAEYEESYSKSDFYKRVHNYLIYLCGLESNKYNYIKY